MIQKIQKIFHQNCLELEVLFKKTYSRFEKYFTLLLKTIIIKLALLFEI